MASFEFVGVSYFPVYNDVLFDDLVHPELTCVIEVAENKIQNKIRNL